MKLEDARNHYYEHCGKLSDVNRQLSFAGIAVVWLFADNDDISPYQLDEKFWEPLLCFVLALAFDLLQYLVLTLFWGYFHRYKEIKGIKESANFRAPFWINWPGIACLLLKIFFGVAGYAFLLIRIYQS